MKNPFAVIVGNVFELARCSKEVYAAAVCDLWNKHSGEGEVAKVVDLRIKRCEECDTPTSASLCEGCEAYAEHTAV